MSNFVDNTNIAALLEKVINPKIQRQIYGKSLLWQKFGGFGADSDTAIWGEKNVTAAGEGFDFKNSTMYFDIEDGRMATGNIPVQGTVNYGQLSIKQGVVSPVTTTGAFLLDKTVLNIKDAGAIVKPLTQSMNTVINSLSMDLNRQCYGDATATLAYVAASGSSTTVTLKPRSGASTGYNGDIPLFRYFPVGTFVKVGSNAVTTVVSASANSIVVAASQTLVADTAVLKYADATHVAPELDGLGLQISATSTYAGLDVATYGAWVAYSDLNGGTARTMANTKSALNKAVMNVNVVGNGSTLLMNITEAQKFAETQTDNVRLDYTSPFGTGYSGFQFMGGKGTVMVDNDCPDFNAFIVDETFLHRGQLQPLEWEPGTNMGGQRLVGQLDYEYIVSGMWQIYTNLRAAHGIVGNIVG